MKKFILGLLFAAISFTSISAQSSAIKVNLLGFAFGTVNAGYEFTVGDRSTIEVGGSFRSYDATIGTVESNLTALGAYAQYRLYFGGDAVRGFYGAPNIGYSRASGSEGENKGSFGSLSAGVLVGNQFVLGSDGGFVIDLALGVQYVNFSTSGDISGLSGDGILPNARLALGFAF